MADRDVVTEARATADLQVAVPLALGSIVGRGVEDLLRSAAAVRHVGAVDVRDVDKTQSALEVDSAVELTVHLRQPDVTDPSATIRSLLADLEAVVAVEHLGVVEAYPIEAY